MEKILTYSEWCEKEYYKYLKENDFQIIDIDLHNKLIESLLEGKSYQVVLNLGNYDKTLEDCIDNLVAFFNGNLIYKNAKVTLETNSFYIRVIDKKGKNYMKYRISVHSPKSENVINDRIMYFFFYDISRIMDNEIKYPTYENDVKTINNKFIYVDVFKGMKFNTMKNRGVLNILHRFKRDLGSMGLFYGNEGDFKYETEIQKINSDKLIHTLKQKLFLNRKNDNTINS